MSENEGAATTEVEQLVVPPLRQMLSNLTDGPSPEQVDDWKQKFGEVFISGFSEKELFVWRPLRRNEWRDLQVAAATEQSDVLQHEETVVRKCLLWPDNPPSLTLKAGTLTTLHEQIMQNSNFLPPQLALSLVQKL